MIKRRVLIIDDSVVARRMIADVLTAEGDIEVSRAPNGRLGLQKLTQEPPELVVLDVEMPERGGIDVLRDIRRVSDIPVIMFSALTVRAGELTLEALSHGASDYLLKPSSVGPDALGPEEVGRQLVRKIRALLPTRPASVRPDAPPARPRLPTPSPRVRAASPVEVLAIGASTGGPQAVTEVVSALPGDFPVPILVVLHMPAQFTGLFAQRLASCSPFVCREAVDGARAIPGEVWVAPGGRHMGAAPGSGALRLAVHDGPPENSCRPAVDVLFRSLAERRAASVLAVVLTGMGEDGLRGAELLRGGGAQLLAQDEASSVVWSMPRAIAEAGLADAVVPLGELARVIERRVAAGRTARPT